MQNVEVSSIHTSKKSYSINKVEQNSSSYILDAIKVCKDVNTANYPYDHGEETTIFTSGHKSAYIWVKLVNISKKREFSSNHIFFTHPVV